MTPHTRWHPPPTGTDPTMALLTPRQADVLAAICLGLTDAEIGRRLYLAEGTVKTHVKSLFRALGARNRTDAAVMACTGRIDIYVNDSEGRAA